VQQRKRLGEKLRKLAVLRKKRRVARPRKSVAKKKRRTRRTSLLVATPASLAPVREPAPGLLRRG
jgi:hypothetical protein